MSSSLPIFAIKPLTLAVVSGLLLVGCGSDNNSSSIVTPLPQKTGVATLATGELLAEPTARNFTSAQLATELEKIEPILFSQMTSQGDKVKCDVRVEYMHYDTVDVKEGKTDATGAVFIPTEMTQAVKVPDRLCYKRMVQPQAKVIILLKSVITPMRRVVERLWWPRYSRVKAMW